MYNMKIIEVILKPRKGFKSAKKKLNTGKTQMTAQKEEDGRITRCSDRIAETVKEFYKKFYYRTDGDISIIEPTFQVSDITLTEVEQTIHQLKRNKAPGQDNITSDI